MNAKENDRRTKFNIDKDVQKRTYNGEIFDSILEMKFYRDVVLPKMGSGEVIACERQKPYILQEKFMRNEKTVQPIKYVADFCLRYADGHEEIIDVKGMADVAAKLKRKLFWHVYPDAIYRWVSYSHRDGGWIEYDTLQQLRRERKKAK